MACRLLLFLQQQFLVALLRLLLAGQQRRMADMDASSCQEGGPLLLQHQHCAVSCCARYKPTPRKQGSWNIKDARGDNGSALMH
jgi:hypothetical protein